MALSSNQFKSKIKPVLQTAIENILKGDVRPSNFRKVSGDTVVPDRNAYNAEIRRLTLQAQAISDTLAGGLAKEIVNHIKQANVTCTIPPGAIATPSGGAGPPTPKNISGTLK